MIRIDLARKNSNHPDRKKRHPSRASCEVAAKAAGKVVSSDADSRDTPSPGRATRPLGAPGYPQGQDGPSTAVVGSQTPEAA